MTRASEKPMTYCVECDKPLDLGQPGSTFFTVIVKSHMRRACAECFAKSDELKQHWIG